MCIQCSVMFCSSNLSLGEPKKGVSDESTWESVTKKIKNTGTKMSFKMLLPVGLNAFSVC